MFSSITRCSLRFLRVSRTHGRRSSVIERKTNLRRFHASRWSPTATGKLDTDAQAEREENATSKDYETDFEKTSSGRPRSVLITSGQVEVPYKVLREDDRHISSVLTACKSRKLRYKNKTVLLEGRRLVQDALKANARPSEILFSSLDDVKSLSLPPDVLLYKVPYRAIRLWSNLTNPAGIIGIFEMPDLRTKEPPEDCIPLTIICDNVRDPTNLGSIIRIAAGVGCEKLVTVKGCVDPWDPKVLRCASGGHFRVPLYINYPWEQVESLVNNTDSSVFVTDSRSICGNDEDGDEPTEIQGAERREEEEESERLYDRNPATVTDRRLAGKIKRQLVSQLPVVPYYSVDYTKSEMILIIPGETGDLSSFSCDLLRKSQGVRINVALCNRVDSLNTSVACGIVVFEMRRQFIKKRKELE